MRHPCHHLPLLALALLLWVCPTRSQAQTTDLVCNGTPPSLAQSGFPCCGYEVYAIDNFSLVDGFTANVTATVTLAPAGGTLSGTTTVQPQLIDGGMSLGALSTARFSNLILTGVGNWQLTFTSSGLVSCTTAVFPVGPSYHLIAASTACAGGLALPGVVTTDFDDQTVPQSGNISAGALHQGNCAAPPPPPTGTLPAPQNVRFGP